MHGTTGRSLSAVALALAALGASACGRSDNASVDSALARDLALATRTPAQPMFQDTAVAPAPEPQQQSAGPRNIDEPRRISPPPRRVPERRQPPPEVTLPQPAESEPAPQPAPAAAPAEVVAAIGAGSQFTLASTARVCTRTSRPGDKFVATITAPVVGSNGAEIPTGTRVVLEVAEVVPGDSPETSRIALRVRSVALEDRDLTPVAEVEPLSSLERSKVPNANSSSGKKKVVGGAIAGAILGQIMGKDTKSTVIGAAAGAAAGAAVAKAGEQYEACLAEGAPLRVTLTEPLVLARR